MTNPPDSPDIEKLLRLAKQAGGVRFLAPLIQYQTTVQPSQTSVYNWLSLGRLPKGAKVWLDAQDDPGPPEG